MGTGCGAPSWLKINGAMMKTIMLTATGMEAPAVTMTLLIGITIAQHVNVKIQMLEPLPLLRLLVKRIPYTKDHTSQTGMSPSSKSFSKTSTCAPLLESHLKKTIQGHQP